MECFFSAYLRAPSMHPPLLLAVILWRCAFTTELGGTVCRLPRNVGWECSRSEPSTAYYFDAEQAKCVQFIFHGCGGNANRFASEEECISGCRSMMLCGAGLPLMDFAGNIKRCVTEADRIPCPGAYQCNGEGMQSVCCKRPERICSQPVTPGSLCGVAPRKRYYYDYSSNQCRPFTFLGCSGNDNNFYDHRQCITFCAETVSCLKGEPFADRYDANRAMICEMDSICPYNYTCIGSSNVRKACCPSREYVCGMPYNWSEGCLDTVHGLWTFDVKTGECTTLDQPACANQLNTFSSLDQCTDFCLGSCPNKLQTLLNPVTGQPQLCNPFQGNNSACPPGFQCFKSGKYAWICCRTEPQCPSGQSIAQMDSRMHALKRCHPSGALAGKDCQPGFTCQQANNLEWICCEVPLSCPQGMRPLPRKHQLPHICSPEVMGSCPEPYKCIRGVGSGDHRYLCCQPEQACLVPYVGKTTKKMIKCLPGDGHCPMNTSCLLYLNNAKIRSSPIMQPAAQQTYYCCLQQYRTFMCSSGLLPLLDEKSNTIRKCNLPDEQGCPSGYQCEDIKNDTFPRCCPVPSNIIAFGVSVINEERCKEALLYGGAPRVCRGPDDFSCASAKCRQSTHGTYYCCRQ